MLCGEKLLQQSMVLECLVGDLEQTTQEICRWFGRVLLKILKNRSWQNRWGLIPFDGRSERGISVCFRRTFGAEIVL
ncbi:hypothetical protein J1N35_003873 [Gossypium stocksii]|uniref:Uncharacterized protein n=1 Tax=Gossypium stocksii TaxID=47602 RepID=A0A9D3WCJ5_9ROSI|nr:hypothetical protein J1N35_003873 [Gossypium stocksii]